jgi:hypothetical protein
MKFDQSMHPYAWIYMKFDIGEFYELQGHINVHLHQATLQITLHEAIHGFLCMFQA